MALLQSWPAWASLLVIVELPAAAQQLAPLVVDPYLTRTEIYAHSTFALSLAYLAQGRVREARDIAESATEHMLETNNAFVLPLPRPSSRSST